MREGSVEDCRIADSPLIVIRCCLRRYSLVRQGKDVLERISKTESLIQQSSRTRVLSIVM